MISILYVGTSLLDSCVSLRSDHLLPWLDIAKFLLSLFPNQLVLYLSLSFYFFMNVIITSYFSFYSSCNVCYIVSICYFVLFFDVSSRCFNVCHCFLFFYCFWSVSNVHACRQFVQIIQAKCLEYSLLSRKVVTLLLSCPLNIYLM